MQCDAPEILDVKARCTILRVKDVLPTSILLPEDKDGWACWEHSKNCAPSHLPTNCSMHPKLAIIPNCHLFFVCGEKKTAATLLLCDQCQHG